MDGRGYCWELTRTCESATLLASQLRFSARAAPNTILLKIERAFTVERLRTLYWVYLRTMDWV